MRIQNQFCHVRSNKIKDDNILTDTIKDFRPSKFELEVVFNSLPNFFLNFTIFHVRSYIRLTNSHFVSGVNTQVARKNDDTFREINRIALAVGHTTVFKDLEELVKDGRMGFFYLIKEENRKRILTHSIGELAACFVTNIAGRCAKQLLIAVALAILTHIKTDAAALIAKQLLCQCFCGFSFTCAGWACKEENSLWFRMGRALQPRHSSYCSLYNIECFDNREVLSFHSFLEVLFCSLEFINIKTIPWIFLNAIPVKINDRGHIADSSLFVLAQAPKAINLGEAKSFGETHELILDFFQFFRMILVVWIILVIHIGCKETGEIIALN